MKAQDLRIGNLVLDDENIIVQIRMVLDRSFKDYDVGTDILFSKKGNNETLFYGIIKPIPLTVEWLKKFGFIKQSDKLYFLPMPEIKAEIHFEKHNYGNVITLQSSVGMFIPQDINYVHELQNLYHSLIREELTLKENT